MSLTNIDMIIKESENFGITLPPHEKQQLLIYGQSLQNLL